MSLLNQKTINFYLWELMRRDGLLVFHISFKSEDLKAGLEDQK